MFVSTKGRYALRVLVELAERESRGEKLVPLKAVAESQSISEKYLEAIVKLMVQGGILEGLRGKSGGYRLLMSPQECTVARVLQLTEGGIAPVSCLTEGSEGCSRKTECRTYPMWTKLEDLIQGFLENVTIADLMAEAKQTGDAEEASADARME